MCVLGCVCCDVCAVICVLCGVGYDVCAMRCGL